MYIRVGCGLERLGAYPEMAHTYAVILLFFFHIEFQTCLIYSKNRFDYNMHLS